MSYYHVRLQPTGNKHLHAFYRNSSHIISVRKESIPNMMLAGGVCYSNEFKFIWIKTAKTGGSSFLKMLKGALCDIYFDGFYTTRTCNDSNRLNCGIGDGIHDLNKYPEIIHNWNEYFVFTVIREPKSRLISMINFCQIMNFSIESDLTRDCGRCTVGHCSPYSKAIMNLTTNDYYVDFIAKMETYERDVSNIMHYLYLQNNNTIPEDKLVLPYVNKKNKTVVDLNETVIDIVLSKYYKDDLAIYNAL